MIRNRDIVIRKIEDMTYLLPYGQCLADNVKGAAINETGEIIWNCLENNMGYEEVIEALMEYYEAGEEDRQIIEEDVGQFLKMLKEENLISEDNSNQEELIKPEKGRDFYEDENEDTALYIRIGTILLALKGDKRLYLDRFNDFQTEPEKENICISVRKGRPSLIEGGRLVIANKILTIYEFRDYYHILFPVNTQMNTLFLDKSGERAVFYYEGDINDEVKFEIFFGICHAFLYRAGQQDMVMLHSASILYRDKLWLFSGPSGTGKSTHTKLWKSCFGVDTVNGDLNLIHVNHGNPIVYGTPWCGTSGIYDNKEYELGGIILLKQAEKDCIEELSKGERILKVNQRLISPCWDEAMFDRNLAMTKELTKNIEVCRLCCTINESAAIVMKEKIDAI